MVFYLVTDFWFNVCKYDSPKSTEGIIAKVSFFLTEREVQGKI